MSAKLIANKKCERLLDLSHEPLGPGWLRVNPTRPEAREQRGDGLWCTGPEGKLRRTLAAAITNAAEVVLLSSFLLADDALAEAMLDAAARGVRVYVLTASEQRISQVRDDDEFGQRMADDHKRLLARLAGKVQLRSGQIHSKFLVVDPQSPSRRGWLSTANFNRALVDGVELAVELDEGQTRALAGLFAWAYWCEVEHELRGPKRLVAVKAGHPLTPNRPRHPCLFATARDETTLRAAVLELIDDARRELIVSSYGLVADHVSLAALCRAARRGVGVTVLTRPRPAVAEAVRKLEEAGVELRAHDKLHAKAILADDQALVMTANLEAHGLDHGFEVGALLSKSQAGRVAELLREWAQRFPWRFSSVDTRGSFLGEFCPSKAGLRDGVLEVTEGQQQSVAKVIAEDALRLDEAPVPALEPKPREGTLPRAVTFTWEVIPPEIPKQAREHRQSVERQVPGPPGKDGKPGKARTIREVQPYTPPVYEHGRQLYVKLRSLDEVDAAAALAVELKAKVAL